MLSHDTSASAIPISNIPASSAGAGRSPSCNHELKAAITDLDKYEQDHDDPGATCFAGGNSRCNHHKFQTVKIFCETVVPARMSLKSEDEIKQRVCVLPGPAD